MLSRYLCGPREVILVIDPAVDDAKSDFDQYRLSCFDTKHLVIKEGETPTYFKITPLTRKQKNLAQGHVDNQRDFSEFIVKCGLVEVRNFSVLEDGILKEAPQPDRKNRGALGECCTDEYLDKVDFSRDILECLAIMIMSISEASVPLSNALSKPVGATE